MHKTLIALATTVLVCGQVCAKAPRLPKDLPSYAPDKPLPVPQIEQKTLGNGLIVWAIPRQGLPRVDYVLAFRGAGLAADPKDRPGFASILAGLLSEGTEKHDSKSIAEIAQGHGGGIGASAGNDGLTLYANALASHAEPMLDLLAEVTRTPVFPEKEVALTRANALQGLKAAEAQPGFRAERAILAAIYGDHPYARTQATEESINAFTREELQRAHAQRLRPDQALLVVTGRIEADAAFALAEKAFGDWEVEDTGPEVIAASRDRAKPSLVHLERAGSVQSALRIGRPAVAAAHEDAIPLRLVTTILGGGFSSRLMQNLREDKGYTYGASVGYRSQSVGGALVAGADVRNEVTGAAIGEFMAEFKRIGTQTVPAAELEMHKRFVAGGYLIGNQLQASVAGTLAGNWLVGLPPEYLGEYVPKVRAVSAEQILQMGRKYYAVDQWSIVVVGDAAVAGQLRQYGKFETVK